MLVEYEIEVNGRTREEALAEITERRDMINKLQNKERK